MKLSLILMSILLASCGEYGPISTLNTTKVGETLPLSGSPLSDTDRANLTTICNSLANKSSSLQSTVNSTLSFVTSQTDCSGNSMGSGTTDVTIQNSGSDFVFKQKVNGLDFIFPNVETNTSGVMSPACQNVASLSVTSNAFSTPNGATTVYYTTTGISPTDCPIITGEQCVLVQSGQTDAAGVRINTKEWIRFRISSTQGKLGFFTYRKKVAQSFCGVNETLTSQATLK
jgi:hypothetical protein